MNKVNRYWLSPCGIDCSKCSIHLRTDEELNYWREKNVDLKKIRCDGCRSNRNQNHWSPDCNILECSVYTKGVEFCSECNEFPCKKLEERIAGLEHHEKAVEKLEDMKREGIEVWLSKHRYS
ncbi:MAG: DUF3795 domain-containing protein [Candidatus Atribacteria bacterium]